VVEIQDAQGESWKRRYDDQGQLTGVTDPLGRQSRMTVITPHPNGGDQETSYAAKRHESKQVARC